MKNLISKHSNVWSFMNSKWTERTFLLRLSLFVIKTPTTYRFYIILKTNAFLNLFALLLSTKNEIRHPCGHHSDRANGLDWILFEQCLMYSGYSTDVMKMLTDSYWKISTWLIHSKDIVLINLLAIDLRPNEPKTTVSHYKMYNGQ